MITYSIYKGAQIARLADTVGAMRIEVFREYPYLYDGILENEREYVLEYAASPSALVVTASEQGQVIGLITCVRLSEGDGFWREPFEKAGLNGAQYCYIGEAVVLKPSRGGGIGAKLMEFCQEHARSLGIPKLCFCAVDRPGDHPLRPADYHAPDRFYTRHGFTRRPQLAAGAEWQQVDGAPGIPTDNTLTFWTKE